MIGHYNTKDTKSRSLTLNRRTKSDSKSDIELQDKDTNIS